MFFLNLSRIERNLTAPSVVSLYRIAQALGVNINYFFTSDSPSYALQRKGTHLIIITNQGLDQHIVLNSDWKNRNIDFLLLTLKGGEMYQRDCISHNGEEFVYVISGELSFLIDEDELILYPGDSLSFSSSHKHIYFNQGEEDCVSIWAIIPRFF
jgi:transcriptional regulator with XRE-family HTH domain